VAASGGHGARLREPGAPSEPHRAERLPEQPRRAAAATQVLGRAAARAATATARPVLRRATVCAARGRPTTAGSAVDGGRDQAPDVRRRQRVVPRQHCPTTRTALSYFKIKRLLVARRMAAAAAVCFRVDCPSVRACVREKTFSGRLAIDFRF